MSFNVAVFVSGNGSNLQAIIDKVVSGELAVNLTLVVSDKAGAYGLKRAKYAGIDTLVLEAKTKEPRKEYDCRLLAALSAFHIDLIVLSGFMRILSADFVEYYQNKIINIHPSLLPKYPGLHTHRRAIEANDREHGTTVHIVTAELDAGPILGQSCLPILPSDDVDSLKQRVQALEYQLYWQIIADIAAK